MPLNLLRHILIFFIFQSLVLSSCLSIKNQDNSITVIEHNELKKSKQLLLNKDKKIRSKYQRTIEKADSLLDCKPFSVTNKTGIPPSGSKHDYMSIGPYWWPNPETPNGLPYIRKDGKINPETRHNFTDYMELKAFADAVKVLNDAYYFSENEAYAKKALTLIKAWFLDEATKMNPNFNYGQSIPGKTEGRKFGIIEFERVIEVLKCLELLKKRKVLDDKTDAGMNAWLTTYADWLQNSEMGRGEANTKNNHGTHYDLQLLNILIYLGRIEEVKEYLSTITKDRIFAQIEPDGSQPKELARTKSISYSVMNLHGFLGLARLGQKVGVDLWDAQSEDGRSIKKGYQYMLPYLTQEKSWEYQQIVEDNRAINKLIRDLKYARDTFGETTFDKTLQQTENEEVFIQLKNQNN